MKSAVWLVLTLGFSASPVQGASHPEPNRHETYRHAELEPFEFGQVTVTGGLFKTIRDRSRDLGVPTFLEEFEKQGHLENFRIVWDRRREEHIGGPNTNEFLYKHLEAMGFYAPESLEIQILHKQTSTIVLVAQRADGYLNTYYENPLNKSRGEKRFQPMNRFEFYNYGHFAQAAIAHFQATSQIRLLKSATWFSNLIVEEFAKPNHLPYKLYRGPVSQKYEHPNHELAMVALYRVTGDERYLDFVRQTLEEYGYFGDKFQEMWGHAVQENLLQAGAANLYLETGEPDIWNVLERLWTDVTERKMYITGGTGSISRGEAYGKAFELPNATAYGETCAAISLLFWHHKMLLATGDSKYADEMERALYNNILSGYGQDGTTYFYQNPLEWDPAVRDRPGRRFTWHSCPCCPPNIHRLLASLGSYIYTHDQDGIQVNLYVDSRLTYEIENGREITLVQETDYPRDGHVALRVEGADKAAATISLRIPAWSRGAKVEVNGEAVSNCRASGYCRINRSWNDGDIIELELSLEPRVIWGNPKVADQRGKLALMRGPFVYCAEGVDNPGIDIEQVLVPRAMKATPKFEPNLLGGVVTLTTAANVHGSDGRLDSIPLKWIPYYAWANREEAWMKVWLPYLPVFLDQPARDEENLLRNR